MVAKELAKHSVEEIVGNEAESSETPEASGADVTAAAGAVVATGNSTESLPSPPKALLSSNQSPTAVADTVPPPTPLDDNNSSACKDESDGKDVATAPPEPETSEDELSEKLRTIQLSRPNVQPLKHSRWRSSA